LRAAGITVFQGYLFAKPAIANLPRVGQHDLNGSHRQQVA
jgi:c-di-GMP-related signal transduction protein